VKVRILAAVCLLLCLSLATSAFAQSTVGTIRGTVTDESGAAMPGVNVKVLNEETGISQSMLTNDTGAYSFILLPGNNYTITAQLSGFKKASVTNIALKMADQTTANVVLQVGQLDQVIEVNAKTDKKFDPPTNLITLEEAQITGLPLVGNDPLALITTLPGYRASPYGHEYDTVGGLPMYMMNTVRDGLSVTDGFSPGGIGSNTILNPDMISEIRLILAPVDAEAGRGNGQIQITTKSGTNKFQWNINYNLRQNALNALGPSTTRFPQPFGATFQYLVSVGGPIIKNKTFYFVNWDHQMRWERSLAAATPGVIAGFSGSGGFLSVPVLTDSARNGVFKYFDGWISGNPVETRPATPPGGTTGRWPIETHQMPDGSYLPVAPTIWADNTEGVAAYTGQLRCFSVFGNVKFDGTPFDPATDCGQYIPRMDNGAGGSPINFWVPDYNNPVMGVGVVPDPSLHQGIPDASAPGGMRVTWEGASRLWDRPPDRTGYVQRLLSFMPHANEFNSSTSAGGQLNGATSAGGNDVLNRAQHAWVRNTNGRDNRNTFRGGTFGFGTGMDQSLVNHKIINLKIDHNIGNHSRISMSTSLQNDQNSRLYFQSRWPDGADGYAARVPRVLTINGISTISPTMVNEARVGVNYNRSTQLPPWENPSQERADFAKSFLVDGWLDPNNNEVSPVYFLPGSGNTNFNFQDNVLPFGITGANAGLQANNGFGASGPIASGCTPSGTGGISTNGTGLSAVNCETGSALYNFADTFSWNRGSHSIRAGAELRLTRANELSSRVIPQAAGGPSTGSPTDLGSITLVPEMLGYNSTVAIHGGRLNTTATNAAELLYVLSGSVQSVNQTFWVNTLDNYRNGTWETWSLGDGVKARRSIQNEYAMFFKDDWRIGQRLTINLGVRYENYGNLYIRGFATGILDEGYGLFGSARTGREGVNPFDYWLTPGNTFYTGYGRGCTQTFAGACNAGSFAVGGGQLPDINVQGMFLPNGRPSYIPGNCPINTITPGTNLNQTATNPAANSGANAICINVGGPDPSDPTGYTQFVPASYVPPGQTGAPIRQVLFTPVVNCVYGVQQPSFNSLLPTSNCDPTYLTSRVFVGPGSDHPDQAPLYRDRNNVGPAIGFSYRMPLGSRTLLIRGGFQYTFGSAGRDRSIGTGSAGQLSQQGGGGTTVSLDQVLRTCSSPSQCLGSSYVDTQYAMTLADLPNLIPLQTQMYNDPQYFRPAIGAGGGGTGATGDRIMLVQNFGAQRALSATAYAPGYNDPRTENYTFSVSTNLTRASSLALSYVGTLGRNRPTGINLNMPNVYHNPELLDALNRTRAGENAPLFDQMFAGWNLTGLGTAAGWGPVGTCVNSAGAPGLVDGSQNINCPAGTIYQSGSAHLRNASTTVFANIRTNLANGNFFAVANTLAVVSPGSGGCLTNNVGACINAGTFTTGYRNATWGGATQGNLLRNGCDRLGSSNGTNRLDLINGGAATGNSSQVRCFPEDWLIMNPALSVGVSSGLFGPDGGPSTSGNGLVYKDTWGYTNYHQFQIQYTLRLNAANLQVTYLTSKTLALPRDFYRTNTFDQNALGGTALGSITGFSDPRTEESRRQDYGESSDSLKHSVRLNGVFQLPIGPGRPLLSKAPGWVHRILGGWQMGIIYNGQSGAPFTISAGDMMYGSSTGNASFCDAYAGVGFSTATQCSSGLGTPDIASPLWTNPQGKMSRDETGAVTYFGNPNPFSLVPDPQCVNGTVMTGLDRAGGTSLASQCALRALVLKVPEGTPGAFPLSSTDATPVLIMLQNPMPGNRGTLGPSSMKQPGRFYLDANLSKTFMFTESRGIQIRVDATNVLNHPTPSDLYLNIGPQATSVQGTIDRFNTSTSDRSAFATGCVGGNAFCGRNVQFGIRMINN
jgi:hypothetical protein